MLYRLMPLFIALFIFTLPLVAQDDAGWEILFYDHSQISILTADGIAGHIELPEAAQNIQKFNGLGSMQLSPDRRWFSFVNGEGGGPGVSPRLSIQVADLVAGTCCDVITGPATMEADTITVGPFSPDSEQFVTNFAQLYSPGGIDPVLAIIDVETMSIVQDIDMLDTFGDKGAFLVDWTEDGITLFPTCLACGGPFDGYHARWNPMTGDIEQPLEYVNFMGTRLRSSGEYLVPRRDERFQVGLDDGMYPSPNVLTYLPDSDPENSTIVYFDPDKLELAQPYWVLDGQAYLLHDWNDPTATLVFRAGTKQVVGLPDNLHFIAGTPDGWLMQRNETALYQFRHVEDEIVITELAMPDGEVIVLDAPLGSDDLGPPIPILR